MAGEYLHDDITQAVIAGAFAVHGALGPGFLESIYHKAMAHELHLRGIPYESQVVVPILYKGAKVGEHKIDLLVQNKVIVELKAVKEWEDVFGVIALSYLTATHLSVALLLNFGKASLEIKRIVR